MNNKSIVVLFSVSFIAILSINFFSFNGIKSFLDIMLLTFLFSFLLLAVFDLFINELKSINEFIFLSNLTSEKNTISDILNSNYSKKTIFNESINLELKVDAIIKEYNEKLFFPDFIENAKKLKDNIIKLKNNKPDCSHFYSLNIINKIEDNIRSFNRNPQNFLLDNTQKSNLNPKDKLINTL